MICTADRSSVSTIRSVMLSDGVDRGSLACCCTAGGDVAGRAGLGTPCDHAAGAALNASAATTDSRAHQSGFLKREDPRRIRTLNYDTLLRVTARAVSLSNVAAGTNDRARWLAGQAIDDGLPRRTSDDGFENELRTNRRRRRRDRPACHVLALRIVPHRRGFVRDAKWIIRHQQILGGVEQRIRTRGLSPPSH